MTAALNHTAADSAQPRKRGYQGFHTELDECSELALAVHVARPVRAKATLRSIASDALLVAARTVEVHGMPIRHDAARQLLAGHLGVYDRYFRLPAGWHLTTPAPGSALTWRRTTGEVVIDLARSAPPSQPLLDAVTRHRLAAVTVWAREHRVTFAGVRILSMAAPATSLLYQPGAGLTPLSDTRLGTRLAADLTPGTMVDVVHAVTTAAFGGPAAGTDVAQ